MEMDLIWKKVLKRTKFSEAFITLINGTQVKPTARVLIFSCDMGKTFDDSQLLSHTQK